MQRHLPTGAALLAKLLPDDCEALVGDLIEEFQNGRSRRWFWRQLAHAVLTQNSTSLAAARRAVLAVVPAPAAVAIMAVIAFEVVVSAALLDRLLTLTSFDGASDLLQSSAAWVPPTVAVLLVAGLLTVLRRADRVVQVVSSGAAAALVGFLTLHAVHPMSPEPFLPSLFIQLSVAAVFVSAVLLRLRPGTDRA